MVYTGAVYAVVDGWKSEHVAVCFQIQDSFWGKSQILGKGGKHLQSGQESARYWDPPVGGLEEKTDLKESQGKGKWFHLI